MNDIRFTKTNGGMARTSASEDPISGIVFGGFGANVITFGSSDGNIKGFEAIGSPATSYIRKFNYVEELSDAGIVWKEKQGSTALTAAEQAKNALYYHISEFFRMNQEGTLYVMINAEATAFSAADLTTLQNYAGGKIRQCGVFDQDSTPETVANMQTALTALESNHKPMSVVHTYNGEDVTLPTLKNTSVRAAGNFNVSVLVGCDGDATLSANLADYATYGCIGACIGAISKAYVHESIAWVQKFPLGLKAPALFNGNLIKNVADGDQDLINTNGYIFVRTHVGDSDNYFNDSHNCDVATSDYAYIENVRTIDKACRGVRANLLPYLNSPLKVDATTGKLSADQVAYLETVAGRALEDMEKAGELSGYSAEIDPDQNVLSTSTVEIVVKNVANGVMRNVNIKIGYTTSI